VIIILPLAMDELLPTHPWLRQGTVLLPLAEIKAILIQLKYTYFHHCSITSLLGWLKLRKSI